MSRLEILMYAVLALTALVLASLFVARIVWTSSRRIRYWRERRNQPDEVAALRAERDRLKAEHAMLARRLELRLRELQERFALQEGDVSRARNRVGVLAEKLEAAAGVIKERDEEISGLREMIASLEADLEKRTGALHEAKDALRAEKSKTAHLESEARALAAKLADRERQLAILREEVSLNMRADAALAGSGELAELSASGAAVDAQERLSRKIEELNQMARRLESQRAEMLRAPGAALERPLPASGAAGEAGEPEGARGGEKAAKAPSPEKPLPGPSGEDGGGGEKDGAAPAGEKKAGAKAEKPAKAVEPSAESRILARKVRATEDVSRQLNKELEEMDALWRSKLESLNVIDKALDDDKAKKARKIAAGKGHKAGRKARKAKRKPTGALSKLKKPPKAAKSGGEAEGGRNVVSLAARIRALKEQTR